MRCAVFLGVGLLLGQRLRRAVCHTRRALPPSELLLGRELVVEHLAAHARRGPSAFRRRPRKARGRRARRCLRALSGARRRGRVAGDVAVEHAPDPSRGDTFVPCDRALGLSTYLPIRSPCRERRAHAVAAARRRTRRDAQCARTTRRAHDANRNHVVSCRRSVLNALASKRGGPRPRPALPPRIGARVWSTGCSTCRTRPDASSSGSA